MITENFIEVMRLLPGCHYAAEPHGKVLFASAELCELLRVNAGQLPSFRDLFNGNDQSYNEVISHADVNSTQRHCVTLCGDRQCYVEHLTRCITTGDGDHLVLGTVRSMESEHLLNEELRVYRDALLNRPEIGFGVHVVEPKTESPESEEGQLSWLNNWSKSHFIFPETIRRVTDLVRDRESTKKVAESVRRKFAGEVGPSDMAAREFWGLPSDISRPVQVLPVFIKDYFVYPRPADNNSPQLRPRRIITLVVPLNVPEALVRFLQEKGARAPVLEVLNIRAFEKVKEPSSPFRFRHLNRSFRTDYHMSETKWRELLTSFGLDPSNTDPDWRWNALLERGIGDVDIYPREIANRYNTDDLEVLRNKTVKEGLEPHQDCDEDNSLIYGEVQFLKMPLIENGIALGIIGFYWPVKETQSIVQRLLELLGNEKDEVLDDLPELLRVVSKNREKRFIFVNRRHATSHKMAQSAFIGRTDLDVFGHASDMAVGYDIDDDAVLLGKVLARYEMHRDTPDSPEYMVLTIKSPIRSREDDSVIGIQCVYWGVDELEKLIAKTRDSSRGSQITTPKIFVSYPRKDRVYLLGDDTGSPRINGLRSSLDVLKKVSNIDYWFDERAEDTQIKTEIKRQISECQIFLLLLSTNFLASDFIREWELPQIMLRFENDKDVQIIPIILSDFDFDSESRALSWIKQFSIPNHGNGKFRESVEQMVKKGEENPFWAFVSETVRTKADKWKRISADELQ